MGGDGWSHAFDVDWMLDDGEVVSVREHRDKRFAKKVLTNHFEEENWLKMGNALSESTQLTSLSLRDCGLYGHNIEALFIVLWNISVKEYS